MGEDDFDDGQLTCGSTDVDKWLRDALGRTSVSDPERLAALIYRHAGADLEARRAGVEAEAVVVRRLIIEKLKELHTAAKAILNTPQENRPVSALEIAIADIIGGPDAGRAGIIGAKRFIEMLKELVSIPVRQNLTEFGEKPELDVTTTRIVVGIAEYCRNSEIRKGFRKLMDMGICLHHERPQWGEGGLSANVCFGWKADMEASHLRSGRGLIQLTPGLRVTRALISRNLAPSARS